MNKFLAVVAFVMVGSLVTSAQDNVASISGSITYDEYGNPTLSCTVTLNGDSYDLGTDSPIYLPISIGDYQDCYQCGPCSKTATCKQMGDVCPTVTQLV